MWDLHCCIMQDLSLWCVDSLVEACGLRSTQASIVQLVGLVAPWHVGSQFLDQRSNLHPLHHTVDS